VIIPNKSDEGGEDRKIDPTANIVEKLDDRLMYVCRP
jgi:hypothetical protein